MTMPTKRTQRSDAEIFAAVRKALDQRPTVPQGVHVHVDRGTVKLTGSVRQPFERADAEEAVRAVEGIRSLVNDIVVTQAPNPAGFDAPEDPS
jgi:osmotically-inducible protein OsmY